jgi:glycosyltransferase involved in cell wall biosynthesis
MRMRIGLVVTGGVDRTGRERVVPILLWLIERLARRHDVHVFALHHYREPCSYPLLGATVHDVGRVDGPPGLRRFRLQARLAAAIAAHGPFDLLHAYWGMPAGVAATHVGRTIGVPVVVSFSSGELVSLPDISYGLQRRWIDRRAIARVARAAARITVDTHFMARLAGHHGIRAQMIPMGIDPRAFPLAARSEGPPWRLLRVASINPVKDHPTLLRAFAQLVHSGLDVHLDIVGEDTMSGAIQAMTRTLGLDSRVSFHGFQPTDRLAAFYARAHLHVAPSRHEAAGVVMLEAASTGLASVGTAVGYLSDWSISSAPDGVERGVAVPVRDPEALARSVMVLLKDPGRRNRLALAARDWTLAHDADWTSGQFEALYEEIGASTSLKSDV